MEDLQPNDIQEWQRADNSKGGKPEAAPYDMNSKLLPTGVAASMSTKIATPTHGMGGLVTGA